jgi:NADH dehydrogenase
VIGDAACHIDPKTKRAVPGVIRAAIEQGAIAAFNIVADIREYPKQEYKPRSYPYIIPVGGKWAVAKVGPSIIYGFLGWKVKILEELRYLISVLPNIFAFKIWLKRIWVFMRND